MSNEALLSKVYGAGPVRRLEIKLKLHAPIDRVWRAITESSEVRSWWTDGSIEAHEGGRFRLDQGEEVDGTVKVCFPPYLFEFTWNDAPASAGHPQLIEANTKSLVRFDLVELDEAHTQLSFSQFLPPTEIVGASAGWHQIVGERLKEFVETGAVSEDPNRFAELQKAYAASGIT